jgi:hypothetical protein
MNFKDLPVRVSGAKRWAQRVEAVPDSARPFECDVAGARPLALGMPPIS